MSMLLAGTQFIRFTQKVTRYSRWHVDVKMVHERNYFGKKTIDVISQEGLLNPVLKEGIPLHRYHRDHLGPLKSTNKNYKYILAVIDSFSKFVWLYPVKSTTSKEVIVKLQIQQKNFGNPVLIISDRGTAFISDEFNQYCREENTLHHCVTTG
ncbi:hypothetical protein Trydic_g8481 [Trypoxylus dichotomus]